VILATEQGDGQHGMLQRVIDALFEKGKTASRLDCIIMAEAFDVNSDLAEIVALLPPGTFSRQKMCDQLNSAIVGHGWGLTYGTVE
jgi:hypothetical protein